MMKKLREFRDEILAFHRDERGESNTMTQIMLLAIGAIVVVALLAFWNSLIYPWIKATLQAIFGGGGATDTTTIK